MAATNSSRTYINHKLSFLNAKGNETGQFAIDSKNQRNYSYVAKHLPQLEHDLKDLFTALQNQSEYPEKFWMYAYYCAMLLKDYYKAYDEKAQVLKYQSIIDDIEKQRFDQTKKASTQSNHLIERITNDLVSGLSGILSIPLHSSQVNNIAALTNIIRMQVVFGKIVVSTSLVMVQQSENLSRLFGSEAINQMIGNLDKTSNPLNVLSVAVFAIRVLMNAGHVLKHTFFPSQEESKLSLKERFIKELSLRHVELINDFAWAVVNGLTNYAPQFGISAPVASWTMSVFLVFDLSMLFYRRHLAKQEYLNAKEQYTLEWDKAEDEEHRELIQQQLKQLEDRWAVTDSTLWFNVAAAVMLMAGFTASIAISASIVLPASFLVCTLAIAMYISSGEYSTYKQKSLELAEKEEQQLAVDADKDAVSSARNDLILAMAKNAVMPIFLMGLYAASPPAAVLLTVSYIGYQMISGYFYESPSPTNPPNDKQPVLGGRHVDDVDAQDEFERLSSISMATS